VFDWAARTPGKAAIVYNGNVVTYRDFGRLVGLARGFLIRHGYVGEGYAIVAAANLLEFWVCSLALRSLGFTTVQIMAPAGLDELALEGRCFVVTPAGPGMPDLEAACARKGLDLVRLQVQGERELGLDAGPTVPRTGAHLLRTSGTTGSYKLVLITPESDAVFIPRTANAVGMDQDTVLAAFNFPSWTGVGYRWVAAPWTVGGTTVLEQSRLPHRALARLKLTHALLVPSMLEQVLATPEGAVPRDEQLKLYVGGGAMTPAQIEAAKRRISPILFNLVASTESSLIACTPIRGPEDMRSHHIADGIRLEIVDDEHRPVPQGVVGRVRIWNPDGAKGYLNNPAATAECFRDGYFYPGDLGSIDAQGHLVLEGRVSDVLNIGGHKVAPFPIEQALGGKLGVPVCLFATRSEQGQEELHVVLETEAEIDAGRVRALLERERKFVSDVKVHRVQRLARTELGKLVRREIRQQVLAGAQ
jgi:acyl-coenzyme A synthetase/AMP-(fatty) acid ligase